MSLLSVIQQQQAQHSPRPQHACMHISFFKNEEFTHSLQTLVAYSLRFRNRHYFAPPQPSTTSTTKPTTTPSTLAFTQLPTPKCNKCMDTCNRLHACLHCVFIGCFNSHHIHQHMEERSHLLSLDFYNYTIYCSKCKDYVYDWEFEEIVNNEKIRMNELLSHLNDPAQIISRYTVWKPSPLEIDLIREKSRVTSHLGLRGLRNLGNTCFMNVILQCMVHNPPLRAFFLSDKHNSNLCSAVDKIKCMACQMDRLFTQFYSGQMNPLIPSDFLWSIWSSCRELVGYAQQDAHEFFISVINNLHNSLTADSGSGQSQDKKTDCCVVHSIFGGVFQSTVKCLRCGNCTTTNDPFVDISLDVRPVFSPMVLAAATSAFTGTTPATSPTTGTPTPVDPASVISGANPKKQEKRKANHLSNVSNLQTSNLVLSETHTLIECLDIFTHEEKLGWSDYKCAKCCQDPTFTKQEKPMGSIKQLSLKKLPLVLSFQLKRYDHHALFSMGTHLSLLTDLTTGTVNGTATGGTSQPENGGKLNMIIKFPLDLDFTRWTTKHIQSPTKTPAKQSSTSKSSSSSEIIIPNPTYQYTLFAVIVHMGTLQSGHYVCYVRQSGSTGRWFRFDDHQVTMAEWIEVSKCEAYMLFYIKKTLEYQD